MDRDRERRENKTERVREREREREREGGLDMREENQGKEKWVQRVIK